VSLQVYFLRHGETEYSKSGGFCGDVDADLTAAGYKMAESFAESYSSKPWSAVHCSSLKRAVLTAKPLCAAINMPPQLHDELKEIRYGEWEGKTVEIVKRQYAEDYLHWSTEPAWNAPTGGETAVEIADRAMPLIYQMQKKHTEGNVLVVSHKATIRIILCSLLGIELGRYRDRINCLAGSISMVRFSSHGPLLELLGDRSYMSKDLQALEGT
jgi:broad specificity phosphatase PhoE